MSDALPRRRFGRTELNMPVFSCGGMRYQHSWKDEEANGITGDGQANLEATIRRALELGINHIETARGYGTSELQLGRILPKLPRDQMMVQTKGGPREDLKEFVANFEKSLGNLQLDYVDLFGLHGLNTPALLELALKPGGCVEQALQWKKEGRIRHLGFSTHGSLPDIVRVINSGAFDYVNLHWYFVNDQNRPALEAARQQDMGVFIISPNDKGGKLYAPPQKLVDLCQPLSPMQFNDLFCLQESRVHTLSLGAARPTDFDEHIQALEHWPPSTSPVPEIAIRLRAEINHTMGKDWTESWNTGLPEFDRVPGEINVREILRLYALAVSLDMVEFAKMRYNLLGNGEHWFPGQKAADVDAAVLAPCLQHNPHADDIPDLLKKAHALLNDEPKKRLSEGD